MFVSIYRQTELLKKPHTLVAISQVHVFMVQFVKLKLCGKITKSYSKYGISIKITDVSTQNDIGVLGTGFFIRLSTLWTQGREMTLAF